MLHKTNINCSFVERHSTRYDYAYTEVRGEFVCCGTQVSYRYKKNTTDISLMPVAISLCQDVLLRMLTVYQEMTQNGTLTFVIDHYDIPDGIKDDDVREAFINRYAQKMNEELHGPYWRARINDTPTEIVNAELERFAGLINDSCKELYLDAIDKQHLIDILSEKLDKQYV